MNLGKTMSVELQVIRVSEFIRLDPRAHLDFEASKKALQQLARACWKRGLDCALLDLRALPVLDKPHFTSTQLAALVRTFREAGFSPQQRLAVLYQHDVHGGVRNFAFIGRMRGLKVQAFTEYPAALHWLSEGLESRGDRQEGEIPISITQPQGEPKKLSPRFSARKPT